MNVFNAPSWFNLLLIVSMCVGIYLKTELEKDFGELLIGFPIFWFALNLLITWAQGASKRQVDNDSDPLPTTNKRGVLWGKLPIFWDIPNSNDPDQVTDEMYRDASGKSKVESHVQHNTLIEVSDGDLEMMLGDDTMSNKDFKAIRKEQNIRSGEEGGSRQRRKRKGFLGIRIN